MHKYYYTLTLIMMDHILRQTIFTFTLFPLIVASIFEDHILNNIWLQLKVPSNDNNGFEVRLKEK